LLEKFDNYQLLSKIATGGMAEIFLAKHINSPVNSMPIAIKKVLKQFTKNSALIKMFLAEARIICNISHENIVRIYDFGKYEEQYFIAMEYVFGQNLGSILNKLQKKGMSLPTIQVIETVLGVLSGLDHAHNAKDKNGVYLNIVHLDMNPNNILISYDGKVKVVDFGIANANYSKKIKGTLTSIQGTYGYLSPEQCREKKTDRRSDIFSVGVILYEMITNKPLFKHLENDAAILNAILNEPIEHISNIVPDIDPTLAEIIMKCLEKHPDNRYSTAMDVREDLMKVYNGLEFDPNGETTQTLMKKLFPAHYIKMTKVIENAQAEYLMDELFNDLGDLEEIDLKEKIRVKEEKVELEKKRQGRLPSVKKTAFFGGLIALLFIGFLTFFAMKDKVKLEKVSVFSSPPGAIIYINGEDTGKTTPSELMLEHGRKYIIEFRKEDMIGGMDFLPSEDNHEVNMKLRKR